MQIPKRKSEENRRKPARDNYITQSKHDELSSKLNHLKTVSQPRAIEVVQRLAQEGDFSENVPYQMAKGKLRGINRGILEIEDTLKHAIIIAPSTQTNQIEVGHTVTVTVNGKQRQYQILGGTETNPSAGVISRNSPLGEILIGRRVGDVVSLKTTTRTVKYTITNIEA